jgi:hypothetical protein
MAAIDTAPWSSSNSDPSASRTGVGFFGTPPRHPRAAGGRRRRAVVAVVRLGRDRIAGGEGRLELLVEPLGLVALRVVLQRDPEGPLRVVERDPVLRTLRPGERRHDRRQVELELLRVGDLAVRVVPQALCLGVGLDQRDLLLVAAGEAQVAQRLVVDREDRDRRAVLRRHVADRRPVGERDGGDPGTVELHELADDTVAPQHLGDRQHEVGRGGAVGQLAGQLEADHPRDQHRHGLAEHRGLRLDAADAPAEDAEAVDHRGVRVGPDQRVRVGLPGAVGGPVREHDPGEVLDVDLVDDAGARRHDLQPVEGALAPAQELVALAVALELELDVALQRVAGAEDVGDHGVVDHELRRHERVDLRRVAAEVGHGLAHGGEVDDGRDAGEVLQDHAGGRELDLRGRVRVGSHPASARTCAAVVWTPSSVRSRFSSSTLRL